MVEKEKPKKPICYHCGSDESVGKGFNLRQCKKCLHLFRIKRVEPIPKKIYIPIPWEVKEV